MYTKPALTPLAQRECRSSWLLNECGTGTCRLQAPSLRVLLFCRRAVVCQDVVVSQKCRVCPRLGFGTPRQCAPSGTPVVGARKAEGFLLGGGDEELRHDGSAECAQRFKYEI